MPRAALLFVYLSLLLSLLGAGACGTPNDGISRELGAACRNHADCAERCLPRPDWPNGFCTRDCQRDDQCPSGAACVSTVDGRVCLFSCGDDGDCAFLRAEEVRPWVCDERPAAAGADARPVCVGAPPAVLDGGVDGGADAGADAAGIGG